MTPAVPTISSDATAPIVAAGMFCNPPSATTMNTTSSPSRKTPPKDVVTPTLSSPERRSPEAMSIALVSSNIFASS